MTVLLVLAFFLVFILLDYFFNSRKALDTVAVAETKAAPAEHGGDYVDGFQVPTNISYHPGHTWLVRERKNVVRVGADEFAASLLGKLERIELPKPGQWIRQGQKVLSFYRDGERTEMVSPTEGEVMEINTDVLSNPAAFRNDPYGKGWLPCMCRMRRIPYATWYRKAWCGTGCGRPWSGSIPCNLLWRGQLPLMAGVRPKTCWLPCRMPAGNPQPANSSSLPRICNFLLHIERNFC